MAEAVYIDAEDFLDQMKMKGLVLVHRSMIESDTVGGVSLEKYREGILSKKLLSFSEISKSKMWGEISQKQVYRIAMDLVAKNEIVTINRKFKIPRATAVSIARSRGFYF